VLNPRSLLATVLSILSCAVIAAGAPASASARSGSSGPRASASSRHSRQARRLRAGCLSSSATTARRARAASRACRRRLARLRRANNAPGTNPASIASPLPSDSPVPAVEESSAQRDAAAIATILATPCQNTEVTPEAGNVEVVKAAVLCLINRKRAEDNESPLEPAPQLEEAAEGHCQELIADDYFAHVSPSGETPVDRIRSTGYIPSPSDGYVIGENLAWGTYQLATAQSIVSAWIASPGHLANILEAQYTQTGIGVTPAVPESLAPGASGATYAQEFGVIIP
jgi:uncharacterized protein YkwD